MTAIAPEQIDLLNLPSLPLASRKALPECPGIYFAIDSAGVVQYIGRSTNLRQRWLQHHRREQLESLGDIRISWLRVSDFSLLSDIESALIEYFQPPLNGSEAQGAAAQLGIKVDAELYQKYRTKLRENGISLTESITNHMRAKLGEVVTQGDIVDLKRLSRDVEELKLAMKDIEKMKFALGELKSNLTGRGNARITANLAPAEPPL